MAKVRYIVVGGFIDGNRDTVQKNIFLGVADGVIISIGSASDIPSRDTAIDDFSHCSIVPAFVDCSLSLTHSPALDPVSQSTLETVASSSKATLALRHLNYCHSHGVLGMAVTDDPGKLKDVYSEAKSTGVVVDMRFPNLDFLKICYSANIEDQELASPAPDHATLCHILQHRKGKKAVVVANGAQQVAEALAAGCDAIEQGYGMGEDNLRTMAKKNVLWIPSAVRAKNGLDASVSGGSVCCRFSTRYAAPGKPTPGAEAFWKKTLAEQLGQLRLARQYGVRTSVGTGAGSAGILHGESLVEEMKLFIKAGYSLPETIRCASKNGAAFFGMEKLGELGVGQKATFLITRGTPQQLPRKLSYLEGVYVNGAPSIAYSKNSA